MTKERHAAEANAHPRKGADADKVAGKNRQGKITCGEAAGSNNARDGGAPCGATKRTCDGGGIDDGREAEPRPREKGCAEGTISRGPTTNRRNGHGQPICRDWIGEHKGTRGIGGKLEVHDENDGRDDVIEDGADDHE